MSEGMIPLMPRRSLGWARVQRPEQAHSELADWQVAGVMAVQPQPGEGVPEDRKEKKPGSCLSKRGWGEGEVKGMVGSSVPNELQVFERLPALFSLRRKNS